MEIRVNFNEKLSKLNDEIIKMGVLVEEALDKAMDSLINLDEDLANQVIAEDEFVNNLEINIEDHCILLIAREQPVASDLRYLVTALKISTQLERMGDHAVHIAKGTIRLKSNNGTDSIPLFGMQEMAGRVKSMLQRVLTAYVQCDAEEAKNIALLDAEVDRIHDEVIREVFSKFMSTSNDQQKATTLLFIDRFLERFGDHITNICEWIVYSVTGEHVELD
ncbi:MAG: phosphate signaling complex protein PhoU [Spirochaetia bacterium]|jgi:phosphate transport system protein|nr:phosphate signaling complex protein PhoU [Spirochaetia bacterium]